MNLKPEKLVFELGAPGRVAVALPKGDTPSYPLPAGLARAELRFPELDELTVVRHFTRLSQKNYSIDTDFYPLGSCTMKYNPKVNEVAAALPGFAKTHPLVGDEFSQGSLELLYRMQTMLAEIGGFKAVSLQPAAGAHGELAGVFMIRAYHLSRGDVKRTKMLIPDSAHGTNPASCTMAGFETVTIASNAEGGIDMDALKTLLSGESGKEIAGIMITNPNTLGLFERNIEEIARLIHEAGGLVYGDGANMNALTGVFKPGHSGIDVMHFNLHKTFSTPHGGGGPGAGMVGAVEKLVDFLPGPFAAKQGDRYVLARAPKSIGQMKAFYGNFGVIVRGYVYVRMLGAEGMRRVAENAVLNANYLKVKVEKDFPVKYPRRCMHEFVAMGDIAPDIHTLDVAKRLIDLGIHPPTIYFPLIVPEAIMVEPTETESREALDDFAAAMHQIAEEAKKSPELLHNAPTTTPVGRLDEVAAARCPVLCYRG